MKARSNNCNLFATLLITIVMCLPSCDTGAMSVTGTMKDTDGNVYNTVRIGNQIWMSENLRTTSFNDGTSIPQVTDNSEWASLKTAGYCYYNNSKDLDYQKKWGALYNLYTVNTGKLAPSGWRVPTDEDWTVLENYLIANGYNWDASTSGNKIGKAMVAKSYWNTFTTVGSVGNDQGSNNRSGFSALPGGSRFDDGSFLNLGRSGGWWSASTVSPTSSYSRHLNYNQAHLLRNYCSSKEAGFSVRLVQKLSPLK